MANPKSKMNKAVDVETKKVKRVDISEKSKAKLQQMNSQMNTYIAAVADEKGVADPWNFDLKAMQFIVPE